MVEALTMKIKARPEFGSTIARAGLNRTEVAKAANLSTRTIDSLARPEHYGRDGSTREATAWKIARGFGTLTSRTAEDAFNVLFIETDEEENGSEE